MPFLISAHKFPKSAPASEKLFHIYIFYRHTETSCSFIEDLFYTLKDNKTKKRPDFTSQIRWKYSIDYSKDIGVLL